VIRNNSQPTQKKEVIKTSKKVKTTAKTELVSNKEKIDNYIEKFGPIARDEMKAFGVPASITLAQGILESGMGYGRLALQGNNHFGIKCHSDWKGKRIYHDDDLKAECFRVYNDSATSYRDHSLFLTGRSRYSFLFDIKTSNYEAWAKGLKKAGYATDPEYPDKLISLIERFDLTRYDIKKSKKSIAEKSKNITKQKQTHTVQKGDTLYSVSRKYDISIDKLVEINQINDKTIYIGQKLKIITKN
jgi:flagellum-specific peptidoglycan hydrolase FlgJ